MQHAPIVAQDIMSLVDKRNDCMAALHKLAAKFAANQPRSSGYKYTATVSLHDTSHLSCPRDGSLMRRAPPSAVRIDCVYANGRVVLDWVKR
jgi:hypothetical protein